MASCHTHAALLGVAAVSAAPTKHSCTNINYPTEFTDFTEFSGCVYSPHSRFCGFCEFCGRIFLTSRFCEFGEICGRTSEGGVGMAGCHTLLSGFSPKPTLQPHFEYWVADDKLAWGIGGDEVFLCERLLQTCDIGSGAKTVLF